MHFDKNGNIYVPWYLFFCLINPWYQYPFNYVIQRNHLSSHDENEVEEASNPFPLNGHQFLAIDLANAKSACAYFMSEIVNNTHNGDCHYHLETVRFPKSTGRKLENSVVAEWSSNQYRVQQGE
jgi:hypothetical protein